jgi:hypothetical protein
MPELVLELARGAISLAVTLIGLGVGWVFGQRLAYQWNLRQKRRETDLSTVQDLQRLYGEFYAVWKLWDSVARARAGDPAVRAELLRRASDVEALVERLVIKLATERHLSATDRDVLGKFRQGCKVLRRSIELGEPLPWGSSEHADYVAFKRLSVRVTLMVQQDYVPAAISSREAFDALQAITANRHETSWAKEGPA